MDIALREHSGSHRATRARLAVLVIAFGSLTACTGGWDAGSGSSTGVREGTFTVTVQNGQGGNAVLQIQGGKVSTRELEIDCGVGVAEQKCSAQFPSGSTVVLKATPVGTDASGKPYMFLGWAGDCSGEGACTLKGNADRYVVADFGGERSGHANYTDASVHGPAWVAYESGAAGALDCRSCHGASLQGQGIAVGCNGCHAWPIAAVWDRNTWDVARWQ